MRCLRTLDSRCLRYGVVGGGYRTCTRSPFHIPAAHTAAAPAGRIDELAEGTRRRRAGKCRISTPCVSRLFPSPPPPKGFGSAVHDHPWERNAGVPWLARLSLCPTRCAPARNRLLPCMAFCTFVFRHYDRLQEPPSCVNFGSPQPCVRHILTRRAAPPLRRPRPGA